MSRVELREIDDQSQTHDNYFEVRATCSMSLPSPQCKILTMHDPQDHPHYKFSQELLDLQPLTRYHNAYNTNSQAFFEAATSNYFKYKIEALGDKIFDPKRRT